jgi:hypothetical protein
MKALASEYLKRPRPEERSSRYRLHDFPFKGTPQNIALQNTTTEAKLISDYYSEIRNGSWFRKTKYVLGKEIEFRF